MRKFKIGDVVRVVAMAPHSGFPVGTVGTVKSARFMIADKAHEYRVNANGDYWFYNDEHLELEQDMESEPETPAAPIITLADVAALYLSIALAAKDDGDYDTALEAARDLEAVL